MTYGSAQQASPCSLQFTIHPPNAVQVPGLKVMLQNFPAAKDQEAPLVESCVQIHASLVVEPYPSEKYEFVNWDDEIPN